MSDSGGPVQPGPGAHGTPSWATGANPAVPAPVEPAQVPTTDPETADPEKKPRPAWLLPVAILAAVVVVAGIVVAIVVSQGGDDTATPTPIPTPTIVGPSPTPSIAPAERTGTTAFTSALPASVLQYAFTGEKPADDWTKARALEAVIDSYSDGGTGALVVDAGQFATAKEATAFAKTLLTGDGTANAAARLPAAGDVDAGGAKVGTYVVQDNGDGTGVAVWTNGTSVFRLTTAVADVVNAYSAFPL